MNKRSARQKVHTSQLKPHISKTDATISAEGGSRNDTLAAIERPLRQLKKQDSLEHQVKRLKMSYKNAMQREKRAKTKVHNLQGKLESLRDHREHAQNDTEQVAHYRGRVMELDSCMADMAHQLDAALTERRKRDTEYTSLKARFAASRRSRDAVRKKLERNVKKLKNSEDRGVESRVTYSLKDPVGTIRPEIRDMLRQLVCEGVSVEHVQSVIDTCAKGFGIDVEGKISPRSVSRIMKEGLIKSKLQVAYDINNAAYLTICGDGTTIKNQQYEAKALHLQFPSDFETAGKSLPGPPVFRTLGVHRAVNHTAKTQLSGWVDAIESCCALFSWSPIGKSLAFNSKSVACKLRGVLTDHASDQKLLLELIQNWKRNCDRELRGLQVLQNMTPEDQLQRIWHHMETASAQLSNWSDIPLEKQTDLIHDAWLTLATQIGEAEFQKLDPDVQFDIDFLAWTGCCMHKELNAVKGGAQAMADMWETFKITPPIALRNKYEATNQEFSKKCQEYAPRGAIKLTDLTGALCNNKDDKKGHQSMVDIYLETILGCSNRFPGTNRSRYGSHCDAAIELIVHREAYIMLLEAIRDSKSTPSFTNIELNIYEGLQDAATLTELAVLCLYAQAIGHPYMRNVRQPDCNALSLGPLHDGVKVYCRRIINNPDLLLNPDEGNIPTLDAQLCDRPDVVYRVQAMKKDLPHLREALISFFEGALKTWERFTTEFESGGMVSAATRSQHNSAWNPATNDISEGSLGQCRQMLRRAPNMTDNERNARVMWQHNGTSDWSETTLTKTDETFVRREARALDASGDSRKTRARINNALLEKVAANRARKAKAIERQAANQKRIATIELQKDADYAQLSSMKVSELDDQIDKLRAGDKCTAPKSRLKTKEAKVLEIMEALRRRKGGEETDNNNSFPIMPQKGVNSQTNRVKIDDSKPPEDEDMYFDNEVHL